MITLEQLEKWEREIKYLKSQYPPPETPLALLNNFAEAIKEIKELRERPIFNPFITSQPYATYSRTVDFTHHNL